MTDPAEPIRALAGEAGAVAFVCRRCAKKLGGGFGPDGRTRLAKALRREIGAGRKLSLKTRRRFAVTILETGCLGLCPKGAVVAVRPGRPGRVLLVPKGTSAAAVAAALGLSTDA